jgi:hypothetical protein
MDLRKIFPLVAIAFLPLACTDSSPTSPASSSASGAQTEGKSAVVPARAAAPRALDPRQIPENGMIGTWGGQHVRITIGAASSILVYDCARGTIDRPFVVDTTGRFSLAGTYTPESQGPAHQGQVPVAHPALYTGSTDGKSLTFTVTLTDTAAVAGPYVVALGSSGHVVLCL